MSTRFGTCVCVSHFRHSTDSIVITIVMETLLESSNIA